MVYQVKDLWPILCTIGQITAVSGIDSILHVHYKTKNKTHARTHTYCILIYLLFWIITLQTLLPNLTLTFRTFTVIAMGQLCKGRCLLNSYMYCFTITVLILTIGKFPPGLSHIRMYVHVVRPGRCTCDSESKFYLWHILQS